jgi:excisionase family DNA binding protein
MQQPAKHGPSLARQAPPVVPVTLRSAAADGLQVSIDLAPLVDAIGARLEAILSRRLQGLATGTAHDQALDVPAAAERLGISQAATWRLIRYGRLDTLKVGARRVVPSSAIDAFLQQH